MHLKTTSYLHLHSWRSRYGLFPWIYQKFKSNALFNLLFFFLIGLCVSVSAQPVYDPEDVTLNNVQSYFNGNVSIKATRYSATLGGPKRYMLKVQKQPGYPEIETVAKYVQTTPELLVRFDDGDATDNTHEFHSAITPQLAASNAQLNISNEEFSKVGVQQFWALQQCVEYFKGFGWIGYDGAGQVPVKSLVVADQAGFPDYAKALAMYSSQGIESLFRHSNPSYLPTVPIDIVGHEFVHGILDIGLNAGITEDLSTESSIIKEGFADIFGLCINNKLRVNAGLPPIWTVGENLVQFQNCSFNNFADPKSQIDCSTLQPASEADTYLKDFYVSQDNIHSKASIMRHWFYLVADGGLGINDWGEPYKVQKIGSSITEKITFTTMVKYINTITSYRELAESTLKATLELGYDVNSVEYNTVLHAWYAVGVLKQQTIYHNHNYVNYPITNIFNQQLDLQVSEYTHINNLTAPRIRQLFSLAGNGLPQIKVFNRTYNTYNIISADKSQKVENYEFIDNDKDGIFDDYLFSNPDLSKLATTVYAEMQFTLNHFKNKFDWSGVDGFGSKEILCAIDASADKTKTNQNLITISPKPRLSLNEDLPAAGIDAVAHEFAHAVSFYKGIFFKAPEAVEVYEGVANIIGLAVKNDFRKSLGLPPIWTIGELYHSTPDPGLFRYDYSNPIIKGQPVKYQGQGWKQTNSPDYDPYHNSVLIGHWWYLLTKGNSLPYMDSKGNEFYVNGIADMDLAELIVFRTITFNLKDEPNYNDLRQATIDAMQDLGYSTTSSVAKELINAWAAVGLGDSYESGLAVYPKDGETDVYPWTAKLGIESSYVGEKQRIFEVSEDPSFDDSKAKVYRGMTTLNKEIQKYVDEKNPGQMIVETEFNLNRNKKYYWRSKLYCDLGNDLCEKVFKKIQWSPTYHFYTSSPDMVLASGDDYPWEGKINWSGAKGATSYEITLLDGNGVTQNIDQLHQQGDDEDQLTPFQTINKLLFVNKDYSIKARIKGPKPGPIIDENGQSVDNDQLQDDYDYGDWTTQNPAFYFTTKMPKVEGVKCPDKVSTIENVFITFTETPGADHYKLTLKVKDLPPYTYYNDPNKFHFSIEVPIMEDGLTYTGTITPIGKTDDYVTVAEEGEASEPFSFQLDNSLIPVPIVHDVEDCVDFHSGSIRVSWEEVSGNPRFNYIVKSKSTGKIITENFTLDDHVDLHSSDDDPKGYELKIWLSKLDSEGNETVGPAFTKSYGIRPPDIAYDPATIPNFGAWISAKEVRDGVEFKWLPSPTSNNGDAVNNGYHFRIVHSWNDQLVVEGFVKSNHIFVKGLQYGSMYNWWVKAVGQSGCDSQYTKFHIETRSSSLDQNDALEIIEDKLPPKPPLEIKVSTMGFDESHQFITPFGPKWATVTYNTAVFPIIQPPGCGWLNGGGNVLCTTQLFDITHKNGNGIWKTESSFMPININNFIDGEYEITIGALGTTTVSYLQEASIPFPNQNLWYQVEVFRNGVSDFDTGPKFVTQDEFNEGMIHVKYYYSKDQ